MGIENKKGRYSPADIDKIKNVLTKTGHIFEYQVCDSFEKKGWLVIPNKFFLDKDENKGREIDLVAYKIDEVNDGTAVATVVVVEAKQSYKNGWVFFTKGEYPGSVNIENNPLFYYNEIDEFENAINKKKVFDDLKRNDLKMIFDFPRKAYCYSEVVSERGKSGNFGFRAVNPTDIHGAIFPVIKAISSELAFYQKRKIAKKEKRFYWVFPLVVYNGSMMEAIVSNGSNLSVVEQDEFQFVIRYRSSQYDDFYSVNIIKRDLLDKYIDCYANAHKRMVELANKEIEIFYSNVDTKSFELIWYRVLEQLVDSNYFVGFTENNFFPRYYSKARNLLEILINDPRLFDMVSGQYPYDYKGKIEKILAKLFGRKIVVDFTNVPLEPPQGLNIPPLSQGG